MGDPRKQRKKYSTPQHPWEAERIKQEKLLVNEYGLKNKKEVWRMNSFLKKLKKQAKDLISRRATPHAENEEKMFLEKLAKYNFISAGAKIEDVLDLDIKDILERRLQTQMLRKGLAKTAKQARQFIVHGHVYVNGHMFDIPSYLVKTDEENSIEFKPSSALADEEHAERVDKKKIMEMQKAEEAVEEEPSGKAPIEQAQEETPEEKKDGEE